MSFRGHRMFMEKLQKHATTWCDVDLALVLDLTSTMQNLIAVLQQNFRSFRTLLEEFLKKRYGDRRKLGRLRVRIVGFRDYNYTGVDPEDPLSIPMLQTPFYDLDNEPEWAELQSFVDQLRCGGGGDMPRSALEALYYAINSEWSEFVPGRRGYQMIVLFTDVAANRLDDVRNTMNPDYPKDMPRSLDELHAEYEWRMRDQSRRLLLFAPDEQYPWNEMEYDWHATKVVTVQNDRKLNEVSIEDIMQPISWMI